MADLDTTAEKEYQKLNQSTPEQKSKSKLETIIQKSKKYINYKWGAIGGLVMGGIVGAINYSHGYMAALIAGLKQGLYTGLVGGLFSRYSEYLATSIKNINLARATSVIIPYVLSIAATYGLHIMKGTALPLLSTVPTIMLAPFAFMYMSYRARKKAEAHQTPYGTPRPG